MPPSVDWRSGKRTGFGVPREVQQMRRLDFPQKFCGRRAVIEVCEVPLDIWNNKRRLSRHGMHFKAALHEQRQTMPANKSTGTGDKNTLHMQDRVRSEDLNDSTVIGVRDGQVGPCHIAWQNDADW